MNRDGHTPSTRCHVAISFLERHSAQGVGDRTSNTRGTVDADVEYNRFGSDDHRWLELGARRFGGVRPGGGHLRRRLRPGADRLYRSGDFGSLLLEHTADRRARTREVARVMGRRWRDLGGARAARPIPRPLQVAAGDDRLEMTRPRAQHPRTRSPAGQDIVPKLALLGGYDPIPVGDEKEAASIQIVEIFDRVERAERRIKMRTLIPSFFSGLLYGRCTRALPDHVFSACGPADGQQGGSKQVGDVGGRNGSETEADDQRRIGLRSLLNEVHRVRNDPAKSDHTLNRIGTDRAPRRFIASGEW